MRIRNVFLFSLLGFGLAGLTAGAGLRAEGTAAPTKRAMTFADLMGMRRLGGTDVSPDGKWMVYSATDVNLDKNTKTVRLWVQAISRLAVEGAGGEAKLLAGAVAGDDGARFSGDGKRVLYVSSRGGSEQVYVADFDLAVGQAGEPKAVTHIATEADGAVWSPDGTRILFTSAVYPDCPALTEAKADADKCTSERDATRAASKVKARVFDHLLYKHWNAFTGDKRSHLFLVTVGTGIEFGPVRDLNPGDTHDVPPFSLGGGLSYAFSPDGKELAFTENLDEEPAISTNADIFTLDLTDGGARPRKVSTSLGGDFNPSYSPDGKWLAWRSQAKAGYESDKFRLVLYDREKKTIKDLLPKFDNWVDEFVWGVDSRSLYLVGGEKGEEPVFVARLDGKMSKLTDQAEYGDLHPLSDGETLLASKVSVNRPGEVIRLVTAAQGQTALSDDTRLQRSGSTEFALTHMNDQVLAPLDLGKLESFWFEAADKTKVQGFLIRPPGFDPSKKYPVKFLIHGGPQGAWGDSWSYRWNAELFAANGYVVVMVNPRGSTGYGQAFVDGVNGDWGGKPFTDLMLGLDYAEKTYSFIDRTRECAMGASYGGYMANWVLGHTNRFKCIVSHDGMFDPESAYGSTEELWFNEWEFKGKPWDYYGVPDAENPYRKWAPMMSAKNFKTPTLVIHSQLDYRLDVSEGYQLFTTLQRLKVPSRMLYFPDEGHWILKPQNSELWYKTVNAWVDEWAK